MQRKNLICSSINNKNKPYQVDYCFASKEFKLGNVEIGEYDDWAKKSDHMPLMITIEDKKFGDLVDY